MAQSYRYPPTGAASSNPSVGVNGSIAPTSSTEVGGINPSGNLQPLQTDASGALIVSPLTTSSTVTVVQPNGALLHATIDASALPIGASTSALQTSGNTSLSSIDGKLGTLGQKTSAGSAPVVIASDQSTLPVALTSASTVTVVQSTGTNLHTVVDSSALPTGASTSALQTTGNASLASIDSKTPALGQALAAASVPVVLTAAQLSTLTPLTSVTVTQATGTNLHAVIDSGTITLSGTSPVSGTVTANQGTPNATPWNENIAQFGGSSVSLGSKVSASSMPVVIASDQGAVAISAASLPLPTGAATSANQTNASQKTQIVDGSGNVIASTTNALNVDVINFPATQPVSGTVTVTQATGTNLHTVVDSGSITVTQATGTNLHTVVDSSALPTGASTSANQTTANTSLSTIVTNQTSGGQKTQLSTPTALTVTQAAITVGTSAVRLTVSGSVPSATRVVLVATPDTASTATFYIGSATVTNSGATRGVEIVAGQSFIANNDAGDYYIVASIASQTVTIMEQV